ncbi:probable LRR receptor-like serine/threonine-protein kinase At1g56130 [Punica granatum]|uniref:non-specific serine/threonine protein kinase n=2 Tax=Punica granatum TaxID=22663 RepID=A0A6P8BMG0_PUNGR|nr:probable LRR receptor-like serine/threonine-protein kinase At1g56130 [Punica granatum]
MGVLGLSSSIALLVAVLVTVSAQPQTDPNEVAALGKIAEHWGLGRFLNLTVDPCTPNAPWAPENANPRIACGCSTASNACHITHLKVYALDIVGEIPSELFALKELVDLNLAQNVLSGPIPVEIEQLSKMEYLSLGINNLSGTVPPQLGNLTKLISLSFSSNNLHGPLPKELGKLINLQQLYIDSSGVTGPIPQELGNLKLLQKLWASDNLFTGMLPEFFGTLTELMDLRFEGTLLEGPIPSSFSTLTKLNNLILGDLTGEDSSLDFLQNQTSLSVLSLRNCRVSGQIPEQLGTFSELIYLDLSFNKLSGQVPASFQDFNQIQFLFLGNNNLSGELPANIVSSSLLALDVSFNPLSGNLPLLFDNGRVSLNFVGTSLNANNLENGKTFDMLKCLNSSTNCPAKVRASSFAVNCGGTDQISASGVNFEDDSETLGAASLYRSSNHQWGVSSSGYFIFNPHGPHDIAETDSQITGALESELYKTARISANSLRYYGLGLRNGKYNVELHFAEIKIEDSQSWKALGRRLFDVYIQGKRVLQDFNIQKEAGGSNRASIKTFEANVTNTVIDIHFLWAGRGTCCIPAQSTYGPLVSAIHVMEDGGSVGSSSNSDKKRTARILGIALGCAGALIIISSVFYLWWTKNSPEHVQVHTDSPRKG